MLSLIHIFLSYDEKEDVQKEESKISAGGQGFAVNAGRLDE